MTDLRAIEQIMNPATGRWVRFPKPIIIMGGDVDSFIAGYQQRMVDEWAEQRAMSDAQLNAIRGRHAAATPGRWYVDPNRGGKWAICSDHPEHGIVGIMTFTEPTWLQPRPGGANLRFILNARRDVAALLAEVERLRALEVPAADQPVTEDRCEYSGEQGPWPGALRCPLPMQTHYHYRERPGSGVEVVYYGSDRARQIEAKERFGG